jgi:hypothetical protein
LLFYYLMKLLLAVGARILNFSPLGDALHAEDVATRFNLGFFINKFLRANSALGYFFELLTKLFEMRELLLFGLISLDLFLIIINESSLLTSHVLSLLILLRLFNR